MKSRGDPVMNCSNISLYAESQHKRSICKIQNKYATFIDALTFVSKTIKIVIECYEKLV